jgi:P-type E1-E2 ATPase
VVTCPCALALATPLAVTAAVGRAARRGILIKGGDALERLATPSTLILDKTGTITEGAISLDRFEGPDWVKSMVLALEAESSHPIAAAFREGLGLTVLPDVEFSRHVVARLGPGWRARRRDRNGRSCRDDRPIALSASGLWLRTC